MIKSKDLMHGDILVYDTDFKHASFYVDGIRLITGSEAQHVGIVWEVDRVKYVLEQLEERTHSLLKFYYNFQGEEITAFRPVFPIPEQNDKAMFERLGYGYSSVTDSLLNHAMGRITFGRWNYRPILHKYWESDLVDCAGLVAQMLNLTSNTDWCKYASVVEPGTYLHHPESFLDLGVVAWS